MRANDGTLNGSGEFSFTKDLSSTKTDLQPIANRYWKIVNK